MNDEAARAHIQRQTQLEQESASLQVQLKVKEALCGRPSCEHVGEDRQQGTCSSSICTFGKEEEVDGWTQLHVGGVDGVGGMACPRCDNEALAEAFVMGGRQEAGRLARHDAYCKHEHQDGLRRGKAETYCNKFGRAGFAWVDYL